MAIMTVHNETSSKFDGSFLRELKRLASKILKKGQSVSLAFVDDGSIRALNKKYRHLDRATDVLSFEMDEGEMLGDIVISVDTAKKNAKRFKSTFADEIKRLTVHGLLHLQGYDHMKKRDRDLMRSREELYLR